MTVARRMRKELGSQIKPTQSRDRAAGAICSLNDQPHVPHLCSPNTPLPGVVPWPGNSLTTQLKVGGLDSPLSRQAETSTVLATGLRIATCHNPQFGDPTLKATSKEITKEVRKSGSNSLLCAQATIAWIKLRYSTQRQQPNICQNLSCDRSAT